MGEVKPAPGAPQPETRQQSEPQRDNTSKKDKNWLNWLRSKAGKDAAEEAA